MDKQATVSLQGHNYMIKTIRITEKQIIVLYIIIYDNNYIIKL